VLADLVAFTISLLSTMKLFSATAVTSLLLVSSGLAQQYDDYADYQEYAGEYGQEDNLYQDYATRQQTKEG
jgi:hypothetical protein